MGVMSCRLGILAFVCIGKYWICAFFQLFVRSAPSKFFNSCSFVSLSLSQSYMPHNTHTYVFLFFVSSHVYLIFPTQKTWLNFFSSTRHSLLRSFHIFIVIQLGFFHVAAVVFGQMFAQLLADNKRKRATTTYKKGVYFIRPRSRVFQFCALQIEIQSEFAKQSCRNLTYAGHIISQDVCGCLAKSIQL